MSIHHEISLGAKFVRPYLARLRQRQKRRTALISAAVTGQIDVRNA